MGVNLHCLIGKENPCEQKEGNNNPGERGVIAARIICLFAVDFVFLKTFDIALHKKILFPGDAAGKWKNDDLWQILKVNITE